MSESVSLPALGESVTEGTVTRWLKQVGDRVEIDEPLLEVSTDKVDTEIPSPVAGVVEEILVAEDETVEVGAALVRIGDGSGGGASESAPTPDEAPAEAVDAEVPAAGEPSTAPVSSDGAPDSAATAPDTDDPSSETGTVAEPAAHEPAGADDHGADSTEPAGGFGQTGDLSMYPPPTQFSPAQFSPAEPSPAEPGPMQAAPEGAAESGPAPDSSASPGAPTDAWAQSISPAEASTSTWIPAPPPASDETAATNAEPPTAPSTEQEPGAEPTVDSSDEAVGHESDESTDAQSAEHESTEHEAADFQSSEAEATDAEPGETDQDADVSAAEPGTEAHPTSDNAGAGARIDEASTSESASATAPDADTAAPTIAGPATVAAGAGAHAAYVTPIVRKLANEKGIDLQGLSGTGVGGRIRKQDVLDAAETASTPAEPVATPEPTDAPAASVTSVESPTVSPLRGSAVPMSRLRRVVAERAVVSLQTSAQLTTVVEVDVTRVARFRDQVKERFLEKTGTKLSFLPFFARAAAEALRQYPIINATIDTENTQIVYPDHEHISIAVDTERGLLTPVVRDAGDLTIAKLAEQIADLASRTRENKLKPDELAGGTFTVTNTGSRGALFDTPLVFLPQSAILGTGIVVKKPVVLTEDGQDSIAVRSMVYLALSYDHRIVDGADAARFLGTVKARLEGGDFGDVLGV